ncbi:nitrile hydratase subunit alpha [Pseudonocardia broussonetiae]|uniref:Nitrile hydratase alpha/Thiocyanate hydrolase gamma domain-containing protein n=1 Tax=Pseudonocardia broussonetiae TaxID=2736640 RepID=A0A6M6JF60_9PSEU|nr:nitrile hydratase subunit alpha [Pseudonocardia broussonetiae]QJY45710.1 hypothetical protein HOP40_07780 [Pseudonocardia broussonetiae]
MDTTVQRLEDRMLAGGLTTARSIDRWSDLHADEVGPRHGAQAVARLWDRPDPAAVHAPGLRRCPCGRRWRLLHDSTAVRNTVVPTAGTCTGWRVLGIPPSRYGPHDVDRGPETHLRFWSDTTTVHHLVVPVRPERSADRGLFDLAALVSRAAMRGVGTPSVPGRDDPTATGPPWAQRFPGYRLDERAIDQPWELRTVALVLAGVEDRPELGERVGVELDRIAARLPIRSSIYTAWLWALARATH